MRVLYITHRVPYPPDKGDRIRNWNVLQQLSSIAEVSLVAFSDEPLPADLGPMNALCSRILYCRVVPRFALPFYPITIAFRSISEAVYSAREEFLTALQWHCQEPFDAIVISASSLANSVDVPSFRNVPLIVDIVDVDSQKWFDFAAATRGPKAWLYRFEGSQIRKTEKRLAKTANTITLVSDAETKLFNSIVGREVAITATNGVDLDYFSIAGRASDGGNIIDAPPPLTHPAHIAFVGAMDYLPNIDAATWFAREVWPAIQRRKPEAIFQIIGRNPARAVESLAAIPGIRVVGSVPDVRPHLADVSVVVVPMRLSRGLQNKVLEALAMGKATVVSPPALAALRAVPGRDLLQAESPQEWIEAVIELLDNEERRRELGANGRRFVEANHDWETCLRPMMDRIRAACPEACPA